MYPGCIYGPPIASLCVPDSVYSRMAALFDTGDDSYSRGVKKRSLCAKERGPLCPQNKPSFLGETGAKRHRNPLQKAPLHKDDQNVKTPLKVTSNPPQG